MKKKNNLKIKLNKQKKENKKELPKRERISVKIIIVERRNWNEK